MRNFLFAAVLSLFTLEAVGGGSPKLQLSQLPDGTLSGNIYMNEAVGLSYKIPSGWLATPDPSNYTPFMSPYGNAVHPFSAQGRVIIQATGGLVVNALEAVGGHPAKTKEPLDVKTSFTFTEAGDCWIAWAYSADERSAEALKNVEVTFKGAPRTESH
jgi:hypothetical protein